MCCGTREGRKGRDIELDRRQLLGGIGVAAAGVAAGAALTSQAHAEEYPRFELGKYAAWVVAPLSTMDFEPDVVLAWGDPYKINWMCLIAKRLDATTIVSNFDGIDSCVYELVNTMDRNNYQVCFPDCGEVVRARTKQTDATFCIPASKLQAFMDCACGWGVSGFGFNFEAQYDYALDYSRPPFYNEVFNMWGLDTGVDWAISGDYGK